MADVPGSFIPDDQFQVADSGGDSAASPAGFISDDQFESHEDTYGSAGQMAKTFLEGAAEGVVGPLAPLAEKHLLGVKPEDMLARREENSITHGVGQAAGLAGSMLTGVGEGALLGKAGEAAAAVSGLGKAAKTGVEVVDAANIAREASLGFKVGSSAVSQAAEMAVLSGSDETSKMILNDPTQSAQTAIANVGLSAALGGATGAFMTGAVSPLWKATAGPKVDELLGVFKNHVNGSVVLPETLQQAEKTLGIEIPQELRPVMSGNPTAVSSFKILKEGQNTKIEGMLEKLHTDLSESVSHSLGIAPEDIAVHSENDAGHELLETFKKEYGEKYGPISEAFEKRNAEAAGISIPDEARLAQYDKILQDGMQAVGTDSPTFKLYENYGQRLLAKDTVGAIDQLKTEIGGELDKALRAGDTNQLQALKGIRSSLADFQEGQITSKARELEKLGIKGAKQSAEELIAERAKTNQLYRDFAGMSNDLTDHLGVGRFTGAGSLTGKLTNKISAEQLLNKFSIKGNSDFIPFLQQHFPEVYEKVRENELKRFLKPAVLSAKGEQPINISKLNSILEKGMAGQKEYVESLLTPEAIAKIQAANQLSGAIPNPKSSGTAGWMTKMFQDMPRSAMAGVAMLTGHNPIVGGILGEMSQRLGRDAPDAIRLAHLKFLGSEQPIKAEGFKAMVDFFHNTYEGQNTLAKATKAVFKSTAQVAGAEISNLATRRDKLDQAVDRFQQNPDLYVKSQEGDVGHYLPNHKQALVQATTGALQYLQGIKPQPHILGPLDKPVPPQPAEIARYNRALDIANNPASILQHVKDGTLQRTDIADLHNLFPAVYQQMSQQLSTEMTRAHSSEVAIPYHTRMGLSMFLGSPVDSSMTPQSIMAAQPQPKGQPQGAAPKAKSGAKSMDKLGKSNKAYMTAEQSAESDRGSRD